MPTFTLQKKNGVTISFDCDLTEPEAREIIQQAHAAHQNVGAFAISLANKRSKLTDVQSGWLKYLAMEISGQLRQQIGAGPFAWLLKQPSYEDAAIQVASPPVIASAEPFPAAGRWVRVKYKNEWRYVGRIDCHGGFRFSKKILDHVSGAGRSAMRLLFPDTEQRLQDEAKSLQWLTSQKLEALKEPR